MVLVDKNGNLNYAGSHSNPQVRISGKYDCDAQFFQLLHAGLCE